MTPLTAQLLRNTLQLMNGQPVTDGPFVALRNGLNGPWNVFSFRQLIGLATAPPR
jgi:hypothetical protein